MADDDKEAAIFKKYIATRKILIADESSTVRSGVARVFADLGAKSTQVLLANTFSDARDQILTARPDIVLAEYNLGKACGLELLQEVRETHPDAKKAIFILVTGNSSQSSVASAAEEEVDGYVLKPFTPQVLRKTILRVANFKFQPPPYYQAIEEGKRYLSEENLEAAHSHFERALELDSKPALACYYLGQTLFLQGKPEEARRAFEKGLSFRDIHYKCLFGLYDLFLATKKHDLAYGALRRIANSFPISPKLLTDAVKLAVVTQEFQDIDHYYSIFLSIEFRDPAVVNHLSVGLIICGKHFLRENKQAKALELFKKAAITSGGAKKVLKEIIVALVEQKLSQDAAGYLKRFSPEDQSSADYHVLDLLVYDLQTADHSLVLQKGRAMLAKGIHSEKAFEILLGRAISGRFDRVLESLIEEARAKYPSVLEKFPQFQNR